MWLQKIDEAWAAASQAFPFEGRGQIIAGWLYGMQESWGVGEAGFMNLVARAGYGFVAAKGKNPADEGAALAEYLRSSRPLGEVERQLLAELVMGDWRNTAGRKSVYAGSPRVVKIVEALRRLEADGCKKEAAKVQVASDFGVSRGTVENYQKMVVQREEMHARYRGANK